MIEKDHPDISVRRQCKLLEVNRNRLKPRQTKVTEQDELIMKNLDEIYTKCLFMVSENSVVNCANTIGISAVSELAASCRSWGLRPWFPSHR